MRISKGLLVLTAVALPLGSVALLQGTAFAGKTTFTGTNTCNFGGTISFNPPLSSAGTAGVKKTVTTVTTTLAGCSGATGTTSIKPIKTKVAKGQNASTCSGFATSAGTASVKGKLNWTGGKPSKFVVSGLHVAINGLGEAGFTASFPVSGSYAGTGNLAVYLTQADSTAIATCSGSISTVHIDQSQSTATF